MTIKSNQAFIKEIVRTVQYFNHFQYSPSLDQIYQFLPTSVSKSFLKQHLNVLVKDKKFLVQNNKNLKFKIENYSLYTMPPHRIYIKKTITNYQETKKKEHLCNRYIKIVSFLPQIKLVGFSGSMALYNAKKTDDIDLFIITAKNRLWTGRFLMILIAIIMNIKRSTKDKQGTDKVCLNMFFDERELLLPLAKQNSYTAHEVLQMRPAITKGDIYQRFLAANQWVYNLFPNGKINSNLKTSSFAKASKDKQNSKLQFKIKNYVILNLFQHLKNKILKLVQDDKFSVVGDCIEIILKHFQLILINRHRTTEIIANAQLWFFPEDFEKTLINTDLLMDSGG